ncbi:Steroid-phosphate phosphatase [Trichinella spiralis]|uniref:Steroid-phosphate phosphatase n=1 Tax=Trichinella spiralis TaxID=6334 RepID=A0ABR3K9L0_TRISP
MTSPQDKQSADKAKSGSGQSDDASFDAFNEGSVYSMMYSMAESQYVATGKVKLTGRRVILIRNAERVDRIFPDWMNMAFDANGKYQPYDLNQPLSLPNRTGSFHQFRYDAPITELGCVVSMMIGRALKFNSQHPHKVFTSPALRCIQSCKNILKAMGNSELKMCIEPAFFEWLSWYEVLPDWISEDDLMKSNYKIDNNYKPILSREEIRNRRNESHIAFYDRCIQAFKNILEIENKPGYMLFVVHSLTMDAISRHLNARKRKLFSRLADKTWRLVPRAMPSLTYMDFTSRVNFEFVRRN